MALGVALADATAVVIGTALVAGIAGIPVRSMGEYGLLLVAATLAGVAASLQLDLARSLGRRAVTLLITALVTVVTLHVAHADLPPPVALVGRLVFPVSGLVSAAEEPLRLDLAARAFAAGVTYDLALIAVLLALPAFRARGQT